MHNRIINVLLKHQSHRIWSPSVGHNDAGLFLTKPIKKLPVCLYTFVLSHSWFACTKSEWKGTRPEAKCKEVSFVCLVLTKWSELQAFFTCIALKWSNTHTCLRIDSLNQSETIHPPIHSTTSSYLSRLITSDSHNGINNHQSCSLSVSLYTAGLIFS